MIYLCVECYTLSFAFAADAEQPVVREGKRLCLIRRESCNVALQHMQQALLDLVSEVL